MSIISLQFLLLPVFFLIVNSSFAQRPIFPNSIILPIHKDASTLQYVTKIHLGQPLFSTSLVLDLGGQFMWVDSSVLASGSSKNPIFCSSLKCSMAKTNVCGTRDFEIPGQGLREVASVTILHSGTGDLERKICSIETMNSIARVSKFGDLVEDSINVKFRDGSNSGATVTIHDFLFSYTKNMMLDGLASGVKGMLGLGNSRIALHSQLSTRFGFQRKFAMCLSSSSGVVLAGDGPYGNNISRSLVYTPLVGSEFIDYFINVKSIKINGVKLPFTSSNLVLDKEGNGGTKISTILPYSTLRGSIYDEFVKVYVEVAQNMNMARVDGVAPFDICFSTIRENNSIGVGPNVPIIDFGLQSELVKWRISGRNSLVQVSDEVMCLGFLNGGGNQKALIVIGGYQLEENLVEFNLGTSMLGFVSLVNGQQGGSCSDFSLHNPMAV